MAPIEFLLPEMFDRIMELLDDDFETLKQCTLTSRRMCALASRRLFQRVDLMCWNEDRVALFRRSQIPVTAVKRLRIFVWSSKVFIAKNLATKFWSSCTNLTDLSLREIPKEIWKDHHVSFLQSFPQLQSLHLEILEFRSPYDVIRLLFIVPGLLKLDLNSISWCAHGNPDADALKSEKPLPIRTIFLEHSPGIEPILTSIEPPLQLWSIRLIDDNHSYNLPLSRNNQSSLRVVDLRLANKDTLGSFDLGIYPSLHTLLLPQISRRCGVMLDRLLSSIKSTHFQNLVFSASRVYLSWDELYDWAAIDEAMLRFGNSARVLMIVEWNHPESVSGCPDEGLKEKLQESLPKCAERGMIGIYHTKNPIWADLNVFIRDER